MRSTGETGCVRASKPSRVPADYIRACPDLRGPVSLAFLHQVYFKHRKTPSVDGREPVFVSALEQMEIAVMSFHHAGAAGAKDYSSSNLDAAQLRGSIEAAQRRAQFIKLGEEEARKIGGENKHARKSIREDWRRKAEGVSSMPIMKKASNSSSVSRTRGVARPKTPAKKVSVVKARALYAGALASLAALPELEIDTHMDWADRHLSLPETTLNFYQQSEDVASENDDDAGDSAAANEATIKMLQKRVAGQTDATDPIVRLQLAWSLAERGSTKRNISDVQAAAECMKIWGKSLHDQLPSATVDHGMYLLVQAVLACDELSMQQEELMSELDMLMGQFRAARCRFLFKQGDLAATRALGMVDTAFELRKTFKVSAQRIEWLEQSARLSEEPPDESHGAAINGAIKDATNVAKAMHPKPNLETAGSIETVGDITHGDTTKFLNTTLESRKTKKQVKHLRSSAASYHSHAGRRNRERANKLRTDGDTKAAMKCVVAAKKNAEANHKLCTQKELTRNSAQHAAEKRDLFSIGMATAKEFMGVMAKEAADLTQRSVEEASLGVVSLAHHTFDEAIDCTKQAVGIAADWLDVQDEEVQNQLQKAKEQGDRCFGDVLLEKSAEENGKNSTDSAMMFAQVHTQTRFRTRTHTRTRTRTF